MKNGGSNRRYHGGQDVAEGRRAYLSLSSWWPFCFGHCPSLTTYLDSKPGWKWIPLKFLNALFRGIAQVVFANNPFSGVPALAGLTWYSWSLGAIVVASTSVAILMAIVSKQNSTGISSGLVSFNAVLLASVTVTLWKPMYNEELGVKMYALVIVGSLLSIFIYDGLTNLLSSFRPPIPILSIPFHILVLALFACMKPDVWSADQLHSVGIALHEDRIPLRPPFDESFKDESDLVSEISVTNDGPLELYSWKTFLKILFSLAYYSGQVFGFPDQCSSFLIYSGMLLYSPLLTLMCIYGGLVSTLVGLFLTTFPNEQVFAGVYGFNGFLAGGALTLFYLFNRYSFMNVTANAVFTAVLQASLYFLFAQESHYCCERTKYQLPVFGIPFLLSTAIFISVTGDREVGKKEQHFIRLEDITFPEMDRKNFYASLITSSDHNHDDDEESAAGKNLMDSTPP